MAPSKRRPRRKPGSIRRSGAGPQLDILADVLKLARTEGALEGEAIEAFADALRERAHLILEERIRRQDDRVQALEAENAWMRGALETVQEGVRSLEKEVVWRKEAMTSLEAAIRSLRNDRDEAIASHEKEAGWRRQTMASLEASVRSLQDENRWRREAMATLESTLVGLQSEAEALRSERGAATRAHDALLAHHQHVARGVAAEVAALASLSPLRLRQLRRRLAALVEMLRSEVR